MSRVLMKTYRGPVIPAACSAKTAAALRWTSCSDSDEPAAKETEGDEEEGKKEEERKRRSS
jgi:hypothetical protein